MTQTVLIHMSPDYLPEVTRLGFKDVDFGNNEITISVPDVEYVVENGYYQDPDEQLCEHYGIDYDQVYCMELC